MADVAWRESLKLHGEIEVGVYGEVAKLTDLNLERRDGRVRVELRGPIGELRKLGRLAPAYASILVFVAAEKPEQQGLLKLLASPALDEEIARAVEAAGSALSPQEWLEDPTLANLLFALDRYEPEAAGTVIGPQ